MYRTFETSFDTLSAMMIGRPPNTIYCGTCGETLISSVYKCTKCNTQMHTTPDFRKRQKDAEKKSDVTSEKKSDADPKKRSGDGTDKEAAEGYEKEKI